MSLFYLTRWKCGAWYRYIKQSYNLEDVRVRGNIAIRNITVIVITIAYKIALQDIHHKGKTGILSAAIQLDLYPNLGLSGNSNTKSLFPAVNSE